MPRGDSCMEYHELDAIVGDGFAIVAMKCCGDEFVADSLTAAKVNWKAAQLDTEQWGRDGLEIMVVLREPVEWYREYILAASSGMGEFREIDEEIAPVFAHLGKEPEVALNVAVVNLMTLHPGWLGVQYKTCELLLLPSKSSVSWVDHDWLPDHLPLFVERANGQKYDWNAMPGLEQYVAGDGMPHMFEQAKLDVMREEQACYTSFGKLMKWRGGQ